MRDICARGFIVNNVQRCKRRIDRSINFYVDGNSTECAGSVKKFFLITAGYRFRTIIGFYPNASTACLNVHAHRRAPGFSRCQAELLIALTRSISRAVIQTTHPIFDTSYPLPLPHLLSPGLRYWCVSDANERWRSPPGARVWIPRVCARSFWIRDNTERARAGQTRFRIKANLSYSCAISPRPPPSVWRMKIASEYRPV